MPDGLERDNFVLHGLSPLILETRRERFGHSLITPWRHLFVRNNIGMPEPAIMASRDDWQLELSGVAKPGSLSRAALRSLGVETLATVLQCSGNGRAYFEHGPSGTQWTVGSAGCVLWSGVPLRKVVDALGGLAKGVRFITATGGDPLPQGVAREDAVVERSVPIKEVLDDAMLVWEINGEALPMIHGGPLRLIVPGFYGCNQIKWLQKLAFTAEETTAKIMRSGYRVRPIGEQGGPDQPSMWRMNVKSMIHRPAGEGPVAAGRVSVTGVAFSGGSPIKKIELSSDGGKRWTKARMIGPDLGRFAWRQFALELELAPGTVTLASRATSKDGATQPELRVENHRGYMHNGWRDAAVTFEVCAVEDQACLSPTDEAPAPADDPGEEALTALSDEGARGRELFAEADPPCGVCHTLAEAGVEADVGPNLDLLRPEFEKVVEAVRDGVGAMPAMGDTLSETQLRELARYVYEASRGAR